MPDEVGLDVGLRVFQAVADASLRAEVDDTVDLERIGDALQRLSVGEIHAFETNAIAKLLLQLRHPRLLQARIIIIVEIVDADDLVAAFEQCPRYGSADEPRSPSNQYRHRRPIGGAAAS